MNETTSPVPITPSEPLPSGVTRPIARELLRLAAPVFASQLLRIGYQWVDALWVKGLGVEATAAVTTSVFVMWSVYSLNDVFGLGVSAFVSQLLGAGERQRAGVAALKGLRASIALGLLLTVTGLLLSRRIFMLLHAGPGVVEQGTRYLSVVLAAAPLPMTALTCETIMRAAGNTRTPLLIDLFSIALNAALAPLLIYGLGPFPAMGVAGAAWATVIAQCVMVLSYVTLAVRHHPALPLARHASGPPIRIAAMARVGIPGAVIGLLFSAVYLAFARAAGAYGSAALAVIGVANRIEALHFVGSVSFGMAGAALVGQNLGAHRPDRATRTIVTANLWNFWISIVLTTAFLWVPDLFLSLFTRDPGVHTLGVPYLRVLALCLPFVGLEIVTSESIMGSGHTTAISVIFTSFSLLRIPLAFLVPRWTGLGVVGIAWVITGTAAIRTVLILTWAMRGTWKTGLGRELSAGSG